MCLLNICKIASDTVSPINRKSLFLSEWACDSKAEQIRQARGLKIIFQKRPFNSQDWAQWKKQQLLQISAWWSGRRLSCRTWKDVTSKWFGSGSGETTARCSAVEWLLLPFDFEKFFFIPSHLCIAAEHKVSGGCVSCLPKFRRAQPPCRRVDSPAPGTCGIFYFLWPTRKERLQQGGFSPPAHNGNKLFAEAQNNITSSPPQHDEMGRCSWEWWRRCRWTT